VLLIFGILGGMLAPSGPLWAFIVGCMLVCCAESGEAGMRKQAGCARGLSIAGIVLSSISLIICVAIGAWLLSAGDLVCGIADDYYSGYCSRRLGQVDVRLEPFTGKHIPSSGLGRVLQQCYCPDGWQGDGMCDVSCNSAECNFDGGDCVGDSGACSESCPDVWRGDGVCNPQCDNWECSFDNGDCVSDPWVQSGDECSASCPDAWRGDGMCDSQCNSNGCEFDDGDCDGCTSQRSAVNTACNWVTGVGAFIIAYPAILHIIYIVAFSVVVCRSNDLERRPMTTTNQGVTMTSSQPVAYDVPTAQAVPVATAHAVPMMKTDAV